MSNIELICWDCGNTWTMQRSRGQYPRRCQTCRDRRPAMERLAQRLTATGFTAAVRHHEPLGGLCVAVTLPWRDDTMYVVDELDVQYLLSEAQHREAA